MKTSKLPMSFVKFLFKRYSQRKGFYSNLNWFSSNDSNATKNSKWNQKDCYIWVRYEDDVYYKELLESFPNTEIIIKVSKPWDKFNWNKWRVTDCLSRINTNSEVYICWNPAMVDSVREWLVERWHPSEFIFNESFTISKEFSSIQKDIFINWNIPWINILSWTVILLWLVFVPLTFKYINTQIFFGIYLGGLLFL